MILKLDRRFRPTILYSPSLRRYFLEFPTCDERYSVSSGTAVDVYRMFFDRQSLHGSRRILYASRRSVVLLDGATVLKRTSRPGARWRSQPFQPGTRLDLLSRKEWKRLGRRQIADLLKRLARELATLHRSGGFHGDIHPGNVLYSRRHRSFFLIDRLKDNEELSGAPGFRPPGPRPRGLMARQRRDRFAFERLTSWATSGDRPKIS
jgi:hypothetical protein